MGEQMPRGVTPRAQSPVGTQQVLETGCKSEAHGLAACEASATKQPSRCTCCTSRTKGKEGSSLTEPT